MLEQLEVLCDLRQSEVRVFGDNVPMWIGKGKGSGTIGFGNGGFRSEIGELGVGGSRVGGTSGMEVDGVGGSGELCKFPVRQKEDSDDWESEVRESEEL